MSSIALVFLSALLMFWGVPVLNATGRLRRFYLINIKMSINDARNACTNNYTDLATIYDEEENTELSTMITVNSVASGWIGAYHCRWSNGDSVTFTKYSSTFIGENCCGAINTSGEWGCFNCNSTKIYFMCKQDHNYSLIHENKTWFEAQRLCRENHTDLVTIRNEEENERVIKAGNNNTFWIGLQYNQSLNWFDGGRSDYTQSPTSNACFTYLSLGGSWLKHNKHEADVLCYKSFIHVSYIEMSWEEAWNYCDSRYSGLLRIESENDQNETERLLKERNISGPVWVGLRQSRLFGFWIWTNGLHLGSWTNWNGGSEPKHQISHHCGAIEEEDGHYKWSDKDCRSEFRVLCELN